MSKWTVTIQAKYRGDRATIQYFEEEITVFQKPRWVMPCFGLLGNLLAKEKQCAKFSISDIANVSYEFGRKGQLKYTILLKNNATHKFIFDCENDLTDKLNSL